MHHITIYTDGSSRGNPGRGGYGVIMMSGKHAKEISQGFRKTTNNRMELLAVIVALETIKQPDCEVEIYSDSKYVVDAVEKKWLLGWEKKQFAKVKNPDLWLRFLKAYRKYKVKIHWLKGHNEHPYNERCDELATAAADGGNLEIDSGYESQGDTKLF